METLLQRLQQARRFPWLAPSVTGLALLILAAAISFVTQRLRERIREQILNRDGEILHAVALMHQFPGENGDARIRLDDPLDQLNILLETSRLKGVLAGRLFDAHGRFVAAFPPGVQPASLSPGALGRLSVLKPVGEFRADARLADVFEEKDRAAQRAPVPLLTVTIPLHYAEESRFRGAAQFILEGGGIAAEFAALDRHLWRHGWTAFFAGSVILVTALGWAFHRLQRANRLLSERTARLLQANHELALAARTSAVGALSAHLIHGLKNPLAGLQSFVFHRDGSARKMSDEDWSAAEASARRMQALINEIVRVLKEETGVTRYEITLAELVELIVHRTAPRASERGVRLATNIGRENVVLANREANLVLLILENLTHNAIEATPPGKSVRVAATGQTGRIVFEVQDEGPGLPAAVRGALFSPCRSSKPDGNGLGLAISKQLAIHLGAELELKAEVPARFVLSLPLRSAEEPPAHAPAAAGG